jgi:hypothetical protein
MVLYCGDERIPTDVCRVCPGKVEVDELKRVSRSATDEKPERPRGFPRSIAPTEAVFPESYFLEGDRVESVQAGILDVLTRGDAAEG